MKISVYTGVSLDGFIARENGALDWLPGGESEEYSAEEEDYGYYSFWNSVDALMMGRFTFDKVLSFKKWPYGNKPVYILSHSLKKLPAHLPETVCLKSGVPSDIYRELASAQVQHLYLDGGRTIQSFLREGLVNELILTVIPILIGSGIRLFGSLQHDIKLKHLETQAFESGLVQSTYKVLNSSYPIS